MTVEEIFAKKEKFHQFVADRVEPILTNLGIQLINANLKGDDFFFIFNPDV